MLRPLLTRLYRIPRRGDPLGPAEFGVAADDIEIPASDGSRLRAWWLPPCPVEGNESAVGSPAVVVVHGWGSASEDLLPAASALREAGLPALFLDARGHGRSDPVDFMSMPRFAEDVESAVAWLRAQPGIDPDRLALVGHSVGAGACLLVASRDPRIAAVVSIASMAHPRELMGRTFRKYRAPGFLVRAALRTIEGTIGHRFDDFAPLNTIARIEAPVLVLHGLDDRAVPPSDASRLVEAGPAATLRLVADADHRTLQGFLPVIGEVIEHLRAALAPLDRP